MNSHIWNKYLPIIRILMKRATQGDQLLDLNITDFERAGIARKSGYKFTIQFHHARVDNVISSVPLARELATALQEDPSTKQLLLLNDYHISMSPKYQLGIKLVPRADGSGEASAAHIATDVGKTS